MQKSLPWVLQQLTSNLITVNTKQDHIVHISTVEPSQIAPVFTMNFITSTRAKVWNDETPPPIFMYRISVVWKQTPTTTHFHFYCISKVSWSQTRTFHVKADWLQLSVLQKKKKWLSKLTNNKALKKHFLVEHQTLLIWVSNIIKVSLESSGVGNWARTLWRKEPCDLKHRCLFAVECTQQIFLPWRTLR